MLNENLPNPIVWFDDFWFVGMIRMVFGITGFRVYNPSDLILTLYRLWFVWALLVAIRTWKKPSPAVVGLVFILAFYALTLLQTNLSSELNTGFKHWGIQGRYIFPVIGTLYVLIIYFFASIPNKIVSGITVSLTLILFLVGSPLKVLLYPASVMFPNANLSPEVHNIEIGNGIEVSQDFISECPGKITDVAVLFSSSDEIASYPVSFKLVDMRNNQVVKEGIIRDVPVANQTWLTITPPPMTGTKDHPYRITITAADDSQDRLLYLWDTTTNVYRGGDAIVHGVPTNNDLIFRYSCKMPILMDWYN